MPVVNPSPFSPCPQFVDDTGAPAVGDKLFFYIAGSNTKQDTYTTSTGATANANPIILDALGQPSTEVWFAEGLLFKLVWAPSTDTDPPSSPIRTWDNLRGMGDVVDSSVVDQWIVYDAAATYISGTSFSVAGNQTTIFQVGRRVRTTNSGGSQVFSTIATSVFGSVTTVTLTNDSGALDSGLSAVAYGIISATSTSAPATLARSGANTDITSLGAVARASLAVPNSNMVNGTIAHSRSGNAETIAIKTASGGDPSTTDPVSIIFRDTDPATGGYSTITLTAATSVTISSGSTLGCTNNIAFRLWLVAFNDAGTLRLGVIKPASAGGIFRLSGFGIASSTAEGGAGAADSAQVFYTGTAVTSKAYTVLGYSTWEAGLAAVGTWGTAPSRIQLYGPGVNLPCDRVQLVYATSGGSATASTTYVDVTGATANVTMSSAANAVLANAKCSIAVARVVGFNTGAFLDFQQAGTSIDGNYMYGSGDNDGNESFDGGAVFTAMVYPNSASAVTYKLQHRGSNLGGGETVTTGACKLVLEELMT